MVVRTGSQRLALWTAFATFTLIVLGSIVRASGSGLGCPDWPTCFGKWIPPLRMDSIIEYSHRALAAVVGLLVAWLVIAAFRERRLHPARFGASIVVALLLVVQAWLGQVVVTTELSPPLVSVHLGTAMLLLGGLLGLGLVPPGTVSRQPVSWLWHAAIAIYAVILVGALVRGSGAGMAFADWPLMDGGLIPSQLTESTRAYAFAHRLVVLYGAVVVTLNWWNARRNGSPGLKSATGWLASVFAFQVVIGASLVWTVLSPFFIVLHVTLAATAWSLALGAALHFGYTPVDRATGGNEG